MEKKIIKPTNQHLFKLSGIKSNFTGSYLLTSIPLKGAILYEVWIPCSYNLHSHRGRQLYFWVVALVYAEKKKTDMKTKFSLLPILEPFRWTAAQSLLCSIFCVQRNFYLFSVAALPCFSPWFSLFCLLLALSPADGGHFEFWNCSPGICLPCLFLFSGTDFWFVNFPSSSCEIAEDVQEVQCLQTICHCFLAEKLSLPVNSFGDTNKLVFMGTGDS